MTQRFPKLSKTAAKRIGGKTSADLRSLTKSEREKLGLSAGSRAYVERSSGRLTKSTPIISARQFQQKKASEEFGERVTLEKRGKKIAEGEARTARQQEASERSRAVSAIRKRFPGEDMDRVKQHLSRVARKRRGEFVPVDEWKEEEEFLKEHMDDVESAETYYNLWLVSPPTTAKGKWKASRLRRSA